MRHSRGKLKGPKQTVSLTIDSRLYRQAKELHVNTSRIAEEAIANEVARLRAEALAVEIQKDLAAANAYVAENGSFAALAREHYGPSSDDSV
jgi:post-segregation antitoxin (ccd killing protein)